MNNSPLSASQTSMPQRRATGTPASASDTRESILADFGQLLQRWQAVTQDRQSGTEVSSSTDTNTTTARDPRGSRMGDESARRDPADGSRRPDTGDGMPGSERASSRDSESARAARRADDERDIESRRTRQRLGGTGAHGTRHDTKPQDTGPGRGAGDDRVAEAAPADESAEPTGARGRRGHCHGAHAGGEESGATGAATPAGERPDTAAAADAADAAGDAATTDRTASSESTGANTTQPATMAAATAAAAANSSASARASATAPDTTTTDPASARTALDASAANADGAASATASAAARAATGSAAATAATTAATGTTAASALAGATGATADADTTMASSLLGESTTPGAATTSRPSPSSTAGRPGGAVAANATSVASASTTGRATIDTAAIDSVVDSLREALEALESLGRRASGTGSESTTSLVAGARNDLAAAFSSLLRTTDASLQAPTPSPTPMQTTLSTPMQDPAWGATLSRQVADFAQAGIQAAEITVNPPELGPMKVELSLSGESLSVAFSAAQPETRQAIEQTLGTLRTMLAEQGMILKDASVDAGPRDNPSRDTNDGNTGQRATREASTAGGDRQTAGLRSTTVQRRGPGLLDLYA